MLFSSPMAGAGRRDVNMIDFLCIMGIRTYSYNESTPSPRLPEKAM